MNHSKPSSRQDVDRCIRETIGELLKLPSPEAEKIPLHVENFLPALGATSIDTLELFLAIESKLGIRFEETELDPSLIKTLDHFCSVVWEKLPHRPE